MKRAGDILTELLAEISSDTGLREISTARYAVKNQKAGAEKPAEKGK